MNLAAALLAVWLLVACGGSRNPSGTNVLVTASGPTGPVAGGSAVTFTMTVRNDGSNTASDLRVVDTIGNQLALTKITCSADGGATCPDTPSPVMTIATLPGGGSLAFSVTATVGSTANGTLTNTMTATVADDTNRTDNSATAQTAAFTALSNIVVTGTGPSDTVSGGDSTTFVMTVHNDGPDAAAHLHLVDTVGGNLTLTAVTCKASGGASCPAKLGVAMDLDAMPADGSLVFNVAATVAAGTSGAITNTLSVTLDNDPTRTDNSAVAAGTAYTARSGVSVTGVGPAAPVPAGGTATFAMTVSNVGPDPATNLRIIDTIGGNLTLTGVTCSAASGAVCPATLSPVLDVPTLAVGGALTFYVSGTVAAGTNGSITNSMTATPDADPDRSDNTGVAVGTATAHNLAVTATPPSGPIAGGAPAVFVMVVANSGPSAATDVQITDTGSSNLTLGTITCAASGGAVCPAASGAAMTAPSIPVNGSLRFTVNTTVNAGANGTASNTLSVTSAGDSRSSDNAATASVSVVSADLGVSQTAPAQVAAGSSTTFTAVVANPGPGAANHLTITESLSRNYAVTVGCAPSPGASCPSPLGASMTLASLPAGRFLTLTYQITVPSDYRGPIVNTVSVSSDGDPQLANNSASATTVAADSRNGSYKAYAADGRQYDLTIDFDALTYTMSGSNQTVTRSFTADASGGGYTVSGNSRLRVATDLIVGGHDFGKGVLPYVAGRNFATSLSQLGGQYNLATRNVSTSGSGAVTHAGTARVSGNVLQVCQTDNFIEITQECGSDLRNFPLTVNGDVFTGIETTTQETFSFRLARSGGATVLLSAQTAADSSLQLRIGLPDSSGLVGGNLSGSSTNGDWIKVVMTPSSYSFAGSKSSATLSLQLISNQGPFAMLQDIGTSAGPGLPLVPQYVVLQASPLAILIGAFGEPTSGLLQVSLP